MTQALLDLFPNIGLDPSEFLLQCMYLFIPLAVLTIINQPDSWKNRRRFFENYAKENGFDPLNPENWYLQAREKIISTKVLKTSRQSRSFF
jgi:hypothetical protein